MLGHSSVTVLVSCVCGDRRMVGGAFTPLRAQIFSTPILELLQSTHHGGVHPCLSNHGTGNVVSE